VITSIGKEFHYENSLMWYNKQSTRTPGHQGNRTPEHQTTEHQSTRTPGHQSTRTPGHQTTEHQSTSRKEEKTLK